MRTKPIIEKCFLYILFLILFHFPNQNLYAKTSYGFTLHFDFIDNWEQAEQIIMVAHKSGAKVLNVVPPAHIWKYPASLKILNNIFSLTQKLHIQIVMSRIDACPVREDDPNRNNYLYANILTKTGILPSGKQTPDFFNETVGLGLYENWLREETEYYGKNYCSQWNLIGFSVGLFNEPFVSQRGSLLCYDYSSKSYEIAQYTPSCTKWWQTWLIQEYNNIEKLNYSFRTSFGSFDEIPMPKNELDTIFGNSQLAYRDLVSSINDWVIKQYNDCRAIWNKSKSRQIPFILQMSGYLPEKFANGRPAFAHFDIYSWLQMADAIGLSLYTNKEYDDWGHASDIAMIHYMYLGVLQKKPIFIMEGGSEEDGAVSIPNELSFFVNSGQILKPEFCIYEFTKAPYYDKFLNHSGYVMDNNWKVNNNFLVSIKTMFDKAISDNQLTNKVYVYDDPKSLDHSDLQIYKQLQIIALNKTIIFIPGQSLNLIPEGSTLLIIPQKYDEEKIIKSLSKNIKIISARNWIDLYR